MLHLTRRGALIALAPVFLSRSLPAAAAAGAAALPGTYALPDGAAKVSALLYVAPAGAGAGARVLDVAMTPLGASKPVTRYAVELTKRLHLIAVSDDFKTFLHEHGERPGADGHFRVAMTFPRGGVWHLYADAVPAGLGQQVMRFALDLGGSAPAPRPNPPPTGLDGSDGRYGVHFDALDLRAGQDAQLSLHVLRDGMPAPDLTPYLGVAAHAVFIAAADLTYIHAHAAPAAIHAHTAPAAPPALGGTGAPMKHDMTGMPAMAMPGTGQSEADGPGHGAMPGMAGAPLRAGAKVAPDLVLHVQAPKAGTYLLWLQFMAGGKVRTVPFAVAVS